MRYTNKKILKITFSVLVCLLMEQLIGLTDTAYLGRVGEAELGASALAGIFYLMIFMLADYVSGVVSAALFHNSDKSENGALSSKAGWQGAPDVMIKECLTGGGYERGI